MITEFDGIELTKEWSELLENGITHFYSKGRCILNYHIHNGICVINTVSLNNDNFPQKLLKDAIKIQKTHKNVIISSTALSMKPYLERRGFIYNDEIKAYERGIKWD